MLSEEEKALKYFYNLRATIDESYMLFDEEINVKCGKDMIKQITLVLKLITKMQKENEEKDRQIKTLNHTNKTYKGMLNKQSKQIDLMTEMIDELSEYYTRYHGKNNEFCKEICIEKDIDCKDCIKQYFERKVEDVKD